MKLGHVLKLITAVFLIWNVLMYLAIAMITWQFNPAHWEQAHRFAFALGGLYIGLAVAFVVMIGFAVVLPNNKEKL